MRGGRTKGVLDWLYDCVFVSGDIKEDKDRATKVY